MAEHTQRGPFIGAGAMMGNVNTQAGSPVALIEPTDGPAIDYQGASTFDVRYAPFNKDGLKTARAPVFKTGDDTVIVDAIPQTNATASVAALQHIVAATAMTLATTCAGGTVVSTYFTSGCPAMVPVRPMPANTGNSFPNASAIVQALALDFGFAVGTTVAGSNQVTSIPDIGAFYVGQWVCVGGAGNSGNTTSLIAQVTAINTTAGSLTLSTAAVGSLANAPIGSTNFTPPFPNQGVADAVQPYLDGGVSAVFNPTEAITRGVVITCSSSAAVGGTFTVKGYDIYGQAMTEAITVVPISSQTVYGKKAFKYILSVTPSNTDAGFNYSVGTSDVFGCNLRAPKWEELDVAWAAAYMSSSTGWLQPDRTNPATTTTGDVRGTIQVSTIGGGSGIGTNQSNNSRRLFISKTSSPGAILTATPLAPGSLFGVQQT